MRLHGLLALALLAMLPAAAPAQFTTYIAPAKKVDTTRPPTVAEAKAKADTAAREALTNMKVWVDSAAGGVAPAESTRVAIVESTSVAPRGRRGRSVTTTFRNGAPAPETASDLPMFTLIGFACLSVGTVILAGRGRA